MPITSCVTDSAKLGFLSGAFLPADQYKLMLIRSGMTGTYNSGTVSYAEIAGDEVVGVNYSAGGENLTGATYTVSAGTASLDFNNVTWNSATLSTDGAAIYADKTVGSVISPVIALFDFGGTFSSTSGTFSVQIPSSGAGVIEIT